MSINSENQNILLPPLALMTLGIKYLQLVQGVLRETIAQGNQHMLIFDREFSWVEYHEQTRWSDFNVAEPVLFNFYHGLELIMKGLLHLVNGQQVQPSHDLENLLKAILKDTRFSAGIKNIFERHLMVKNLPPQLRDFLNQNHLDVDMLYGALRYPGDVKLVKINNYWRLHYNEKNAVPYFESIISDSNSLCVESVKLYREYERLYNKKLGE